MRKLLTSVLAIAASFAITSAPALAARNSTVIGNNWLPAGSKLTIDLNASVPTVVRKLELGTPIVATVNRIVTSTNMKVGAYTIAAQPDVPRNITVTSTPVSTADTMGTITVVGTDPLGNTLTEVITPVSGSTVAGAKVFKTVTSVTGAGWVINAGNDTITVGVGNLIGVGFALASSNTTLLTTLGATVGCYATTTGDATVSTIDASAATYDGSKKLTIYVAK